MTENGCERWEGGGGMTKGLGYTGKKASLNNDMMFVLSAMHLVGSFIVRLNLEF